MGRHDPTKHLKRALVLLLLGAAGFMVFRRAMRPPSFGQFGLYRGAAIDDIAARPLHYAGQTVCVSCHDDFARAKKSNKHRTLSCETCHGAGLAHAKSPVDILPMRPKDEGVWAFCFHCHGSKAARPKWFSQIGDDHFPGFACIKCHNPHSLEWVR